MMTTDTAKPVSLPEALSQSGNLGPLPGRFFSQVLTSGSLAHGYIFKGNCTAAMYATALQLARVLNCLARTENTDLAADASCGQCRNCLWIGRNAHPEVLTISRLTYRVDEDGADIDLEAGGKKELRKEPTQILTGQIHRLLQQLAMQPQGTRVVIFTDFESAAEAEQTSPWTPPAEWAAMQEALGDHRQLNIRPLHRSHFNPASANRFLKTLEEPPPHTLFVFITDSEENLMDTIVSRCQVVPFHEVGRHQAALVPEGLVQPLESLLVQLEDTQDPFAVTRQLEELVEAEGLNASQALLHMQALLHQRFREGYVGFGHYSATVRLLSQAVRHLEQSCNPHQTLVETFRAAMGQRPALLP
ncbi:MAG: hypothetical protein AB7P76_11860 [Candidatus Melainabacteria bacterium]